MYMSFGRVSSVLKKVFWFHFQSYFAESVYQLRGKIIFHESETGKGEAKVRSAEAKMAKKQMEMPTTTLLHSRN